MSKQHIPLNYGKTFETDRRIHPHIWDSDYCLLRGLAAQVEDFATSEIQSGMKVIDFGCGGKPYRSLFPKDIEYIGIDSCSNASADIVIQPGEPVPMDDGVADCIISTQVVYLIPEYKEYLKECKRLLKVGGRLFISTHGTWTHHPASGGDYYRFTKDGLRYILSEAGFDIQSIVPIIGTLGTGSHLRQLIYNSWLCKIPIVGRWLAKIYNVAINVQIMVEEKISPLGTRMSTPVIFAAVAILRGSPTVQL